MSFQAGSDTSRFLYLLVARRPAALARSPVPRLHLQHGAEKLLRGLREEANLSVGVKAVQVGRLGRKGVIDVLEQRKKNV